MKTFQEVENYMQSREHLGIQPGLERMEALLEKLGHPEQKYATLHVAGTNGKGSTVQMIATGLQTKGLRVGTFTSPSYTGLTGHIKINDETIKDNQFTSLLNEMQPFVSKLDCEGLSPTPFEILTALGFLYFAKETVDIAIIEAGMGGRFDTTNCIEPVATIITSIDIDHEQFLGNTIEEIALHKAGTIKRNRPVIIGRLPEAARQILEKEASSLHATLYRLGEDFGIHHNTYTLPNGKQIDIKLSLEGEHQRNNAALALTALYLYEKTTSHSLPWEQIQRAFQSLSLAGRFEEIYQRPTIIVDSAHNVAAVETFIKTARSKAKGQEAEILFAAFSDKQVEPMVEKLQREFSQVTCTTFNHKRATDEKMMKKIATKFPNVTFEANWQKFIKQKITNKDTDSTLFITGSLHFIMLVRNFLLEKNE